MFPALLFLHSVLRWLVLLSLLFAIIKTYKGLFSENDEFSAFDDKLRLSTVIFAHLQGGIGLILYFVSPLIATFMGDVKGSMALKEIRFFGVEHGLMALIAIVLITIGSAKSKRKETDKEKFKTIAIWFTIALILIFFAIPWSFMPNSPARALF